MERVITNNLNGNAYQLDEPGYQALLAYLDDAAAALANTSTATKSCLTSSKRSPRNAQPF